METMYSKHPIYCNRFIHKLAFANDLNLLTPTISGLKILIVYVKNMPKSSILSLMDQKVVTFI